VDSMTKKDAVRSDTRSDRGVSLFGADMTAFIDGYRDVAGSAYDVAHYVMTHGGRYPADLAIKALGAFDAAVLDTLREHPAIGLTAAPAGRGDGEHLVMYVNALGRLHIRKAAEPRCVYGPGDRIVEIGHVFVGRRLFDRIAATAARAAARERRAHDRLKAALDTVHRNGALPRVLEEVIDHVEHVESVCFYVGDRFLALIDRFTNLIDTKSAPGYLPALRGKPYADWSDEECLVVAALHALFISGRSVRFEEFNGITLTAAGLWEKLEGLLAAYRSVGCTVAVPKDADLFDVAQIVRDQTFKGVGAPWLRYRWIYALNFQKTERVLPDTASSEDADAHLADFADDHLELIGTPPDPAIGERAFFTDLARASLQRDLAALPCGGDTAAGGWWERLVESIVASAVRATGADYGMSSSLRDVGRLIQPDVPALLDVMNGLEQGHFFTCFVGRGFEALPPNVADVIATSVQKRMMFNRWHFFPGNFERGTIARDRHWYYPPLIPDIAIHSDQHRASHGRARVKFSIRAPGPDMSRPPLSIGGHNYRGFYDVRVVRMDGRPFSVEDMLRTRRRTLWMECLYDVLVAHLESRPDRPLAVTGFEPGAFRNLPLPAAAPAGVPDAAALVAAR